MSSISLPGFDVLDTLRQTSKTVTVKAVQRSLERTVALTFLRPELATDTNEVRRFLSIARVCAQVKADGLPQIYDITSHGAQPYIVMEYVEGLNIAEIVRQNGPLPVVLSIRVAMTVADALNHAWQQSRLVHRNLKPSEIRIDERGTPKLTDFGRATVILPDGRMADEEEPGIIIGTPNFLSPEQVQGHHNLDCRADIYALGASLYYMVTGRVPFPDSDPETVIRKQLTDQIPHPRSFRPEISASVSGLISRLLMKVPGDRYADWTAAMGDMQLALKNLPLSRRETPQQGISTVSAVVAMDEAPPAPELPQLRKVDIRATVQIPILPPGFLQSQSTGTRPPPTTRIPVRVTPTPAATPATTSAPARTEPAKTGHTHLGRLLGQLVLWLLLAGWLILLGNDRVGNPLKLPLPSPLLPLDKWIGMLSTTKTSTPPAVAVNPTPNDTPTTVPVAPVPVTPGNNPPPAIPQNTPPVAPPTPLPTPPPPKPADPEKPRAPQTLPPETVKHLADALAQGDLAGARTLLAGNIPLDAAQLAEFRSALDAIPDPMQLAEQTVLAAKGQELTITYMGKERKITPRSVANGIIEADFAASDGTRPVTLKLSKFTPEEFLALLPLQPETPAVHAAVCIALLKANHKADIAAHVPSLGVLSPIFAAAAQP